MDTAKSYDLPAVPSFTKLSAPAAGSTIETNSPGLPALFNGKESSPPGDALVAGLLLICLFAAALLIPFERLMPQESGGSKSSPSINTGSQRKKSFGGTERGQCDEK